MTGFALFAMLFGAGNLIFPPTVGYIVGDNWKLAALGFCITGIGFPLLGIIASGFAGSELDNFSDKISPLFSRIFNTVLILTIGPFLAIPRTGATAFEIMVGPHLETNNHYGKYLFLLIYFGCVLLFSLKESKVIELIGKILTPILLIVLAIIICKGLITPIGDIISTNTTNNFRFGFYSGYQTMDTLAAIIFASIILKNINSKNKLNKKEQLSFLLKSSGIAIIGLAVVYCGILYIGATASGTFESMGTTQLLNSIVNNLLGKEGNLLLGICVSGACLTTAIGLTATVGDYFNTILKVDYKKIVIINVVLSFIFSSFGVDSIVKISAPILTLLYPIAIVLIILNFLGKYIKQRSIYIGCIVGAGSIGVIEMLNSIKANIPEIEALYLNLPLQSFGLAWMVPTILCGLAFKYFVKIK